MAVWAIAHSVLEIVVVGHLGCDLVIDELIDAGAHELELDRASVVHECLVDIHKGYLADTRYSSDSLLKCCT